MKLSDEEKEMEEPEEEERPDEPPSKTPPPRTSQETAETSAGSKDTPSCPAPEDVMAVVDGPSREPDWEDGQQRRGNTIIPA